MYYERMKRNKHLHVSRTVYIPVGIGSRPTSPLTLAAQQTKKSGMAANNNEGGKRHNTKHVSSQVYNDFKTQGANFRKDLGWLR
jgi:hypothetical protein